MKRAVHGKDRGGMAGGEVLTPAVEAALVKAGPKVAAALGMDVVAGGSDVAAVGEAGLNPLADGAGAISTPIAAEKDAEAIGATKDILEAIVKSPGGKALLEQSGKTIAEIEKEVATRGPAALKEALESPAGKGFVSELKGALDKIPPSVRGAAAGAAVYVAGKVGDFVSDEFKEYVKPFVEDHFGKPGDHGSITISENGGPERPLKGGLTGRVIAEDGKDIEFKVGRDTYSLHNLPKDRYDAILANGNALQHIQPERDGGLSVSMPAQAQPAMHQQAAPGHESR